MVICCVCGCEMTSDKNIPQEEWDRMDELITSDRLDEMTEIQHIANFEGYVCKQCYYKG